jgi:TetR/AcrR family transcriptional regulator, transcriptional repressor for nem operon
LEHYAQTVLKSIREQLSAPGSPLANIEQTLKTMQAIHGFPDSKGCMIGTNIADFTTADEEMAAILRSYLRQLEDAYCNAIARAQAVGELNLSVDARDLARMLLCTTQGMALVGRVLDDELLLEGVVKSTMALLKKT